MISILIVEDDAALARSMSAFLEQRGYEVMACAGATQAYDELYTRPFDLIISDIMMPGVDGFEFAESVRSLNKQVPILFTTARDDLLSKERGFRIGIDDYLVKPVDLHELLWRIEALLRRARIAESRRVTLGNVTLDADERSCTCAGAEIPLTAREFDILFHLLSSPRKTFTRAQLMGEYWDSGASSARSADVHVTHLRAKLAAAEGFEIKTVYGMGYKVVPA